MSLGGQDGADYQSKQTGIVINGIAYQSYRHQYSSSKDYMAHQSVIAKLMVMDREFKLCEKMQQEEPYTWSEVNTILNQNYQVGDYNAFPLIESKRTFNTAVKMAIAAQEDSELPWYRYSCVKCQKDIEINRRTVRWYIDHQMSLPVYCQDCLQLFLT